MNITNDINGPNDFFQPTPNSQTNGSRPLGNSNTHSKSEYFQPAPLDLDLMADLEDIINRKTSPLESTLKQGEHLDINMQFKRAVVRSEAEPASDLILLSNGGKNNAMSTQYNQSEGVIFDPLLETSSNVNSAPIHDMPDNNLQAACLPRPPSKSSIQHIARNHSLHPQEMNRFQHQPLARTFEPNAEGDLSFCNEKNPFAPNKEICPNNDKDHIVIRKAIDRNGDINKCDVSQSTRPLYSKSSENLLKEYGLDFSKMSLSGTGHIQDNFINPSDKVHSQTAARQSQNINRTAGKNMDIFADLDPLGKKSVEKNFRPVPPPRPMQPPPLTPSQNINNDGTANQLLDLSSFELDTCDPLQTATPNIGIKTNSPLLESIISPQPPVVPPRTRRSSKNSYSSNQSNWQTFE